MTQKIPWIGTGWKMNKLRADAVGFANTLKASAIANTASAQTFVLPPFPYIAEVAEILKDTRVKVKTTTRLIGYDISGSTTPTTPIAEYVMELPVLNRGNTNGTVTAEMDLLTFVPVLNRYRLPD